MRNIVTVVLALGVAPAAAAQSFDCSKAGNAVEKVVCADAQLRELDEHLGRYYAAARAEVGTAASCLQTDQAAWLKTTRGACRDAACLRTAYLNRLAELDPLQPGATAIRNMELPQVAALEWVIGPASDKVAAPPNPKATPFEATGTLLNEVAGGDGFMLDTGGEALPLAMLMFLEGDSSERLASLAKAARPTYRVRGHVASDGARRFFEPSRCTFIHRTLRAAADGAENLRAADGAENLRAADGAENPRAADGAENFDQELERVRTRTVAQGKVCPDPNRPCDGFKANELSFAIAQPFKFDRGRDRSQPFYAVILKSGALCGVDDTERVAAQKQFPDAKVFLHRHMCEDFGDKVTYAGINATSGFVAVYAGESEADARKVLAQAKAAGYADANMRRLEVIVVYQIE